MEQENKNVATVSISFGSAGFILFVVFLILKLTNAWNISWFWVFFPLWLPWAIGLVLFILAIICILILSGRIEDKY